MDQDKWQGESVDSVLRKLLKQGRLDPQAERLAEQGIDRLRTFLGGTSAPAPTPEEVVDAEVEADAGAGSVVATGRGMLMHTIPLPDGTRVEVLVPERLTRAEAERVSAVLGALAVEE
ncbi:hypothetical protein [Kineococcus aurantiacus]|uniref:Uncharacterized protein n=1 Tax=Kineococcus aurantiacus TaxID=37633 RepID=A0A7Y9AST6_9ACTN|nr:hypothetical protein [Kineococcus aurantiacus]NYD21407.1 hypothetical protein [Kineococcus aurantiacus]